MYRFVRTSLTTIGLTSIALAALAGGRAQSADTDLQPALQQIRDDVRDLRHDVQALRELLEKKSLPAVPPQTTEKQSGSTAPLADGAYYIYSRSDSESQLLTPLIDQLRGQGYPITKIDIAHDLKQKYGVDPDPISFHPLLILKQANGSTTLQGLHREDRVRSIVGKFFAPPDPSAASFKRGHFDVILTPKDPAADALPDLKDVPIESYVESFVAAGPAASGKKMTGNEILASIGGRPVFASEIFQSAFARALTPEGTSLLTATKTLAAGKISEQDFRELQVFAIRKFAKDYIRTRALSQALVASLGKTQKEKTENAVAEQFNTYLEKLKKDLNVATVFEVDKKLREQGTSLLSLKAEFRDRLLADEYLRGVAKGKEEPSAKASPMVGHPDDRPTAAYFFYSKQSRPCQRMMPIIDRLQAEGHRIIKVDVDAPMTWEQTTRFRVTEVPTIWFNAGDQGGALPGFQTEETIRRGLKHFGDWRPAEPARARLESHAVVPRLDRHVTVDCDNLPVSEVLDQIFRDRPKIEFHYEQPFSALHYPYFHFPASESDANRGVQTLRDAHEAANLDARCPGRVTLHVADVPVSVALRRVFDQLHVGYKFENEILRIEFPADEKLREALQRRVTFDCEKLSLRKFIDHICKDWHLGNVVVPVTINLQAPITMHVKETTLESVLKQAFEQAGVQCEFQDGMLLVSPAVNATQEDRRIGELIARRKADPEDPFIAEVVIEGNSTMSTPVILQKLKVTAGRKASTKEIQDDVRTLWRTGWFYQVETKLRHSLKGPGHALVFVLTERPTISRASGKADPPAKDGELGNVVTPRTGDLSIPLIIGPEEGLLPAPKDSLVLLCYPVADLLATPRPRRDAGGQEKVDFNPCEKLIRTTVEPTSWEGAGGNGKIEHDPKNLSLAIRQTQPVHEQIRNLLHELRDPQHLSVTFHATVLGDDPSELPESTDVPVQPSVQGGITAHADSLRNGRKRGAIRELPPVTVAFGKEATLSTEQRTNVWPSAVRLRVGQLSGTPQVWFDFLGDQSGSLSQQTKQERLLPDLRPVTIVMKVAPDPTGLESLPGLLGQPPQYRFLRVVPVLNVGDAFKQVSKTK